MRFAMRENNLLIICVTIIICLALILTTYVVISDSNSDFGNIINSNDANVSNSANAANDDSNNASSSNENSQSTSNPGYIDKINWASFYADGNPNTGEQVTMYVGSQYAYQSVQIAMDYIRDGESMHVAYYETYTVNADGTIFIPGGPALSKYPDACKISLRSNGHEIHYTCYLERRKGTQNMTLA